MGKANPALICLIALFFVIPIFTSCTTTLGPAFKPQTIPGGKALVYVYRYKARSKGALKSYVVEANGFKIASLYNNSYIPYATRPGLIEFTSRAEYTSSASANLEAGQIYYLRLNTEKGALVGRPNLKFVSEGVGEEEIKECKLTGG